MANKTTSISDYSLSSHLNSMGYGHSEFVETGDGQLRPKGFEGYEDPINEIFGKMSPEQILCYTINLFYRHRMTLEMQKKRDVNTSDIRPPKKGEGPVIALGLMKFFKDKSRSVYPDVLFITKSLESIIIRSPKVRDPFAELVGIAARHVYDARGAHWLLSSNSRISAGHGEVAEISPHIWMMIQDVIIKYLSPPQLVELILSPISPKNPGEKLRQTMGSNLSIKTSALMELLKFSGKNQEEFDIHNEGQCKNLMSDAIELYKHRIRELAESIDLA